jgi:AraC-like DNA-binding protein
MAGMCWNGHSAFPRLTVRFLPQILSVCLGVPIEMTSVFSHAASTEVDLPYAAEFSSHDLDHMRCVLNEFYYPAAVAAPDGTDGFVIDVELIQLGPVTVGAFKLGASVSIAATDLDAYHVTLPTSGRVDARHAGHEVAAEPSTGALFGPIGSVHTLHHANVTEFDVKIERSALEAELSGLLGRPVRGPIDLPPMIDLANGPGQSWCRLVRLVHRELRQPENLLRQPLIADRMRHTLLTGLLLSVSHRYRDELSAPAQPGTPRAIRRAVDAIRDEPERPFSVADLAGIAGMSVRSLQEGFRRHLGCAPMTYLQQVRLERVHEDLGAADPARVTVAAVAHRWGFAHLGRFASAYRQRFGVSPSTRLRGSP